NQGLWAWRPRGELRNQKIEGKNRAAKRGCYESKLVLSRFYRVEMHVMLKSPEKLQDWFLSQIQGHLVRGQLAQQPSGLERFTAQCQSAQERYGISQQPHAPGETQAVEKHFAQAQLIFFKRLCWFDPRPDSLQERLGGASIER